MAPDTKTDGDSPVYVLSSFEIARRLKQRFDNANQAGAAMPQFARALVYKMWEGGANVTQDTLLRFTEALEALGEQDEAEAGAAGGVTPQTDDQTFEAADQLVSRNDTPARPGPDPAGKTKLSFTTTHALKAQAAARHRPAPSPQGAASPAAAATSPHPGDDGLVIDPADGDAPTPTTNDDDTEVAI